MLTQITQKAISLLHCIDTHSEPPEGIQMSVPETSELLGKLQKGNLIRFIPGGEQSNPVSYCLCRPLSKISLLNVLEATGEHLNCNYPTSETFYSRYGRVAQRLGVINHLTRSFLEEIKLTEC